MLENCYTIYAMNNNTTANTTATGTTGCVCTSYTMDGKRYYERSNVGEIVDALSKTMLPIKGRLVLKDSTLFVKPANGRARKFWMLASGNWECDADGNYTSLYPTGLNDSTVYDQNGVLYGLLQGGNGIEAEVIVNDPDGTNLRHKESYILNNGWKGVNGEDIVNALYTARRNRS
jgi:hypothetical protein